MVGLLQLYGLSVSEFTKTTPGYYTVNLWPKTGPNDAAVENRALGAIKAEVTSDVRTGYHRRLGVLALWLYFYV